jgi:aminoglycoside phosphotransferase (APT) family kinase protein
VADDAGGLAALLLRLGRKIDPAAREICALERLSGGASKEVWSFDLATDHGRLPLILRREQAGERPDDLAIPMATEARVLEAARLAGVPAPAVRQLLRPADGAGYLMDRVAGETAARKIIRDPSYAEARARFAEQAGAILARIHTLAADGLGLRAWSLEEELADLRGRYERGGTPRPVFELAFRWLAAHRPRPSGRLTVVHGDFRNGNLIFGEEGIRAVLDWELAHLGDPLSDLGWLCVNSWRFGEIDLPVGGMGGREALYSAYEAAGGERVDRQAAAFWEVFGTLRWGVFCAAMAEWVRTGRDRSVERIVVARRASEAELDLLRLLLPGRAAASP